MSLNNRFIAAGSVATFAAVLLAGEGTAHAQAWLKDRRYAEGAGIRAGDLELHPGIAGEVGYDSNWFLRSSVDNVSNGPPNAPPEGAMVLRITPQFYVSTINDQRREGSSDTPATPPTISFRGGASATYREFIGPAPLSDQRNVSINADARLEIFPQRPLTVGLLAGYIRNIRPTVLGNPDISFNSSNPYVGGDVTWTPGNGTFDTSLGYTLNAILFEQSAGAPFTNLRHDFSLKNRWRFRPRTALFQETNVGIISYTQADRATNLLNDSVPMRTRFGLNGLVLPRFAVLAAVGYGGSFYRTSSPAARQFDSVIGQAEGRFYLTDNPETSDPGKLSLTQSSLSVGFVRDFENSYLGNFVGVNKAYVGLDYFFGGRFLVAANGGFSVLDSPQVFTSTGTPMTPDADGFTLLRPEATVFGEYRFTSSFAVNATFQYAQTITDVRVDYNGIGQTAGTAQFALSWSRIQAFGGVRLFL